MSDIINTVCYTLTDALIWFALGCMVGYVFKPEKRRKDV